MRAPEPPASGWVPSGEPIPPEFLFHSCIIGGELDSGTRHRGANFSVGGEEQTRLHEEVTLGTAVE